VVAGEDSSEALEKPAAFTHWHLFQGLADIFLSPAILQESSGVEPILFSEPAQEG
jgi:hypothetical protein